MPLLRFPVTPAQPDHLLTTRWTPRRQGRELGLLAQMVENRVVGAPCGVMDQMASLLGQQHRLLALLCQPAEPLAYVDIPSSLAVWGIDSGIRHAVSGADYGSVRVGAFIGFRMMERLWTLDRQAARRADAEDEIDESDAAADGRPDATAAVAAGTESDVDTAQPAAGRRQLGGGYLANLSPSEFEQHFADLPEHTSGADFLAAFPGGTGDAVTTLEPGTSYAVRQPTKHPVYEHFRVARPSSPPRPAPITPTHSSPEGTPAVSSLLMPSAYPRQL